MPVSAGPLTATAAVSASLVSVAALASLAGAGASLPRPPSVSCPWVGSSAPISQRVSQLLAKMTMAQKVTVLTGASGSSYVGFTPAIGALCIPAMNLEDGPAGVGDGMASVTQLPAPVNVAATWDTAAERLYGQVIGAEQAAKGSSVDLGPTINIVRDPRWGRAFESIGEDPYLNGTLGAADIQGVQSTGVMAQVKHFAVYNQETNRNTASDDAVVSTRAEQEIYLPAFQDSTQQGAASSVMCSYSTVNGTYACQNPYLLSTVLRQQFGFGGFVTSDWFATHATAASANAGPGPGHARQRRLLRQRAAERGLVRVGVHRDAELHGHPGAHRDVRVRPVRRAAGRVAGTDRDQLRARHRRAAVGRGGHRAAEEQRRGPAAVVVGPVDRGHRRGRLVQPADRGRRQRRA